MEQKLGHADGGVLALQVQEHFVVLRLDVSPLQLLHYALVALIVLLGIASEGRFPVLVWRRPLDELVLLVVLPLEAQLAYLDVLQMNFKLTGQRTHWYFSS